jgi:CRP/FNR family transcriptional regulator
LSLFSRSRLRYQRTMRRSIQQSCFDCGMRPDRLFADLPANTREALDSLKTVSPCRQGSILFREGEAARGIFVLCEGRASVSVCSESGRRLALRVAGPGEVLGLSACLSSGSYEVTAETLDDAPVASIRREDLLRFLCHHHEACLQVAHLLSQDLHIAYHRLRSIGWGRLRRPRVRPVGG